MKITYKMVKPMNVRHEASSGLSATAELLVIYVTMVIVKTQRRLARQTTWTTCSGARLR